MPCLSNRERLTSSDDLLIRLQEVRAAEAHDTRHRVVAAPQARCLLLVKELVRATLDTRSKLLLKL